MRIMKGFFMRSGLVFVALAAALSANASIAEDDIALDIATAFSPYETEFTSARCRALTGTNGAGPSDARSVIKRLKNASYEQVEAFAPQLVGIQEGLFCLGENEDVLDLAEQLFPNKGPSATFPHELQASFQLNAARAAMALRKEKTARKWINQARETCPDASSDCFVLASYLEGKLHIVEEDYQDAVKVLQPALLASTEKATLNQNLRRAVKSALAQAYSHDGKSQQTTMVLQDLALDLGSDANSLDIPVYATAPDYRGKTRTERAFFKYSFTVNADGTLSNINLVSSFGARKMARHTEKALALFRYIPSYDGANFIARDNVTFTFRFGLIEANTEHDKKALERLQSRSYCNAC